MESWPHFFTYGSKIGPFLALLLFILLVGKALPLQVLLHIGNLSQQDNQM